jgi:hypothetical protein
MHPFRWFLILVCAAVLLADAAARSEAGLRFEVEFESKATGAPKRELATVWLSGPRLRIEQTTPAQKNSGHVLIYRGDRDRLYSLDPGSRAYLEVDRDMLVALGLQLQAARRELDAQMSRLPADQHAMLERLLGARDPAKPMVEEPMRVVATERREDIALQSCEVVDLVRGGEKVGEACTLAWSKLRIDPRDLDVFRQLANFQRELMGARGLTPFEVVPDQPLDLLVQFDGLPLRFRKLSGERETSSIRVLRLDVVEASDALFAVPEGYAMRGARPALAGPNVPARQAP